MGRPRKWASDAERMKAKRSGVSEQNIDPVKTNTCSDIEWHPEVDVKSFDGIGRGVPHQGFVLISRRSNPNGDTEHGVVTEQVWRDRLNRKCPHGLLGWSCKECL